MQSLRLLHELNTYSTSPSAARSPRALRQCLMQQQQVDVDNSTVVVVVGQRRGVMAEEKETENLHNADAMLMEEEEGGGEEPMEMEKEELEEEGYPIHVKILPCSSVNCDVVLEGQQQAKQQQCADVDGNAAVGTTSGNNWSSNGCGEEKFQNRNFVAEEEKCRNGGEERRGEIVGFGIGRAERRRAPSEVAEESMEAVGGTGNKKEERAMTTENNEGIGILDAIILAKKEEEVATGEQLDVGLVGGTNGNNEQIEEVENVEEEDEGMSECEEEFEFTPEQIARLRRRMLFPTETINEVCMFLTFAECNRAYTTNRMFVELLEPRRKVCMDVFIKRLDDTRQRLDQTIQENLKEVNERRQHVTQMTEHIGTINARLSEMGNHLAELDSQISDNHSKLNELQVRIERIRAPIRVLEEYTEEDDDDADHV